MWWAPIVTGIIGIVGTLLGIGVNAYLNERNRAHQLEDRQRERQYLLADKHQDNLRHAYSEFIAAMHRCLESMHVHWISVHVQIQLANAAKEDPGRREESDRAIAEAEAAYDAMSSAHVEVHEKAANVFMLDDGETFRAMVQAMIQLPRPNGEQVADPQLEAKRVILLRTKQLTELQAALMGHFAPKLALEPPNTKAIEAPSKLDQLVAKNREPSVK
jgi:hypothetical protein